MGNSTLAGASSFCCSSSSVTAGAVRAAAAERLVSHAAATAAGAPASCADCRHSGLDAPGAVQDAGGSKASTSSTYCPSDVSDSSSCGDSSNNSSSCCSEGNAAHGLTATPAAQAGGQHYQVQQQRTPECPCQPRKVSFDCTTQQQRKATPVCVAALKAAAAAGSRATPPQQRHQPAQQRVSSPGFVLTAGGACAGSDTAQGASLSAAAVEPRRADSSDVPQTKQLHLLPALSEPMMVGVSAGSSSAGCVASATTAAENHVPACGNSGCAACADGCQQAEHTSYSAPTHTGPLQEAVSAGHSRSLGTLPAPSRARRVVELGCSSSSAAGQRKPPLLKANSTAAAAQGPAGNIPSPKSVLLVAASPPKPAMLLQRIRSLTQRERRRHSVDLTDVTLATAQAADAGPGSGSEPAPGVDLSAAPSPPPPELSSPPRHMPRARPAAGAGLASPLAALSKLTGFLSPPSAPFSVRAAAARSQSACCSAPCCEQTQPLAGPQHKAGSCQAQRGAACAEGGTAALMVGLAGTGCAGVADGLAWEGHGLISPSRGCSSAKGVCMKVG